jgi:hypothetical protein
MIVKTAERVRFVNELCWMNIHGASLLLGLDGFAQYIRLKLRNDVDELYGVGRMGTRATTVVIERNGSHEAKTPPSYGKVRQRG